MKKDYPYLRDSKFLLDFAKEKNKEQRVKITILDFHNEKPIKEIQGRVISGNINIDGKSSIRRTANLTAFIEERDASYMEIGGIFSLNKKIKIEMGITNNTTNYKNFPIIWFPLGVYVIMNLSSSHSTSGTTVTLQLKDKMVFLNGECGGTISAAVDFHEYEVLDSATGDYIIQKPTIYQIIQEVVNHFGGESLERIIISDIDTRIKKVMKWTGDKPLYRQETVTEKGTQIIYQTESPPDDTWDKFETGSDIGYIYSDFYYPGELIGDAGSSVVSILDKIKGILGNYEYFYDLDGNFVFQEIKNYLNTSKSTVDLKRIKDEETGVITKDPFEINSDSNHYFTDKRKGDAEYVFDKGEIITSYSNSPQYANVKNDFIVWGARETVEGHTLPIRYHLAIDDKPKVGNQYSCFYFEDANKVKRAKYPIKFNSFKEFPTIGEIEKVYMVDSEEEEDKSYPRYKAFIWNPEKDYYINTKDSYFGNLPVEKNENGEKRTVEIEKEIESFIYPEAKIEKESRSYIIDENMVSEDGTIDIKELFKKIDNTKERVSKIEACLREAGQMPKFETQKVQCYVSHYHPILDEDGFFLQPTTFETTDWRTELYLSGTLADSQFGINSNYYYTELVNEWPKIYDIEKREFKEEALKDPYKLDYYLDFIDSSAEISKISISNIGRRTKVINSNDINCIFEREIPDCVLIESGQKDSLKLQLECFDKGQKCSLVSSEIYSRIVPGGTHNSAYNEIRNLLYQYTSFNESISIQMIPLYFLNPNIRITVRDDESGINGDYIINTISIPLDINGTTSLSCSKALERI
jgi:hypothetical protein